MVVLLIQHGADPNIFDGEGKDQLEIHSLEHTIDTNPLLFFLGKTDPLIELSKNLKLKIGHLKNFTSCTLFKYFEKKPSKGFIPRIFNPGALMF